MSFAGSRYLQGVEKFETDALGIPNIYFTFGRRTSDTTPENQSSDSPVISGCFDISNIYGINRDGTVGDGDAGGIGNGSQEENGEYTRFLRIKSDVDPWSRSEYSPGEGYFGGAQGYRNMQTAVVDPASFIQNGDCNPSNGIINGNAENDVSGTSNVLISRNVHVNIVDNGGPSNPDSSEANVTRFMIDDTTSRIVRSPQGGQFSNVNGHGYAFGCCRIERNDPIQDANLENLDAGVTAGFFTLTRGNTGTNNNQESQRDHFFELHRHLSKTYAGPHNTPTKWNSDFTTADLILKNTGRPTRGTLQNAANKVDENGDPIDPFKSYFFTDISTVANPAAGDICTDNQGNIICHRTIFGKLFKITPSDNTFQEATYTVIKHSKPVRGAGGYNANGTEKDDPEGLEQTNDGFTVGPEFDGIICDNTGQFNLHEVDGDGNLKRLSDRVLFCFAMRARRSPWSDFFDNGAPNQVPGGSNDYNQGLGTRGLYIIVLNEDKTKVAFDSNNAIWDYRAIYFYPAVEAIGSGNTAEIVFPFATTQDGIFDSNDPGRIATGSVTLRPNFPEH
jgi:hypothetical protein